MWTSLFEFLSGYLSHGSDVKSTPTFSFLENQEPTAQFTLISRHTFSKRTKKFHNALIVTKHNVRRIAPIQWYSAVTQWVLVYQLSSDDATVQFNWFSHFTQVGSLTHRLVSGVGVDLLWPWRKWTPGPLSSNKCWASQPTAAASAFNHKASRPRALNQQQTARRVQSQETLVFHLNCLQVSVDLQAGRDAQARNSNGCDIRVTRVDHRVLKREREENPFYVVVYCKFEAKIKEAGRNTPG